MSRAPKLNARGIGWDIAGSKILGAVDMQIYAQECLAVVGPNGAGKTTLLRLVAGLLQPSRGELRWEQTAYRDLSRRELARRIAYVPQSRPLRVPLTVRQLVLLGRYPYLSPLRLAPRDGDFRAVAEAMRLAGIEELQHRRLDELSGGERQCAYIAAGLAQEAEVLILDEPTTHLDPRHQREIAALLLGLNRQRDLTILVATHDLNFAGLLADRILALRKGEVVACEAPREILRAERLKEVFEAPFSVVRGGEHPVTVLEMEP